MAAIEKKNSLLFLQFIPNVRITIQMITPSVFACCPLCVRKITDPSESRLREPRSVGGVTPAPAPARPGEREVSPGHVGRAGHRQGQASQGWIVNPRLEGGGCHATLILDKITFFYQGCIIFNRDR